MCKNRYDDKCIRVDTRVMCIKTVSKTINREEYSEYMILRSVKQLILFENQNIGLVWW